MERQHCRVSAQPLPDTESQAIAGLEYGVEGMKVGGIRQIVISPHLAYGKNKVAALPANAALRFEIELLNIQSPDPHQIPTTK